MTRKLLTGNSACLLLLLLTYSPCLFTAGAQNITVAKTASGIALNSNGQPTLISTNTNDVMPVAGNGEVFYVRKEAEGDQLICYNIATQQETVIIATGMKAVDGYTLKGTIINMVMDKDHSRVYLANKDKYTNTERPQYLTWYFDMSKREFHVFKDGRVTGVDKEKVEVLLDDRDLNGAYTAKMYFSTEGKLLRKFDNEYK